MPQSAPSPSRCRGPVSRRAFLQAGSLALGGITLDDVLAAQAVNNTVRRDASVILLYMHGGPSQLETYDLKPDAPSGIRSVFRPIATNVPGIDICEHFPRQAAIADKFSLVRSLNHDVGIHSDGGIVVLTGKRPTVLDPNSTSKSEHPDFGHVASKLFGFGAAGLPPYVAIPQAPYMTRPTYLGVQHAAFVAPDPSKPDFRAPSLTLAGRNADILADRRRLLDQLDTFRRQNDPSGHATTMDEFRALAFELLTSSRSAAAYDLAQESDALRDRYGRHLWGQGCLLARRLAEAGTPVITLYIDTPKTGPEFTNWDDHIQNAGRPGHFGDFMRIRLAYLDEALSALIEDIYARGLDRKILVVAMGEFGRTPRISQNAQGAGRDHWPQAYTALVSGGGLRMGQAIGATNARAEYPTERPYTPQDLLATVYRHLGIDPFSTLIDRGRPTRILESGAPIRELT